jgi:peptidoglycan/xylan/chitin deacetylase (PgdA/CDA1 family)
MKKLLIIFSIFIVLLMACGSDDELNTETGNPGTTQTEEHYTTHYPTPDKLCAITFDDGPDTNLTNQVLDRLENYDVVATFFVIGQKINSTTKPVLERAVSLGCEIGNHSWGYASMDTMSSERITKSAENTTDAIEENAGISPHFFRPPNLVKNNTMFEAIDLPFAGGGVIGYDWQGCGNDAEAITNNVIRNMEDGVIIVLHDVQPEPHPTPEALDILTPALKDLGYEFVTLSDLFDRKGVDPDVEYKMWTVVE